MTEKTIIRVNRMSGWAWGYINIHPRLSTSDATNFVLDAMDCTVFILCYDLLFLLSCMKEIYFHDVGLMWNQR